VSLRTSAPIYVTRKTADGETANYSLSIWMTLLVILLLWLNVVVWGCLGLYEAVRVIV
jgi:hypothetical protein